MKHQITTGSASAGLRVEYLPRRQLLRLSGWYDHFVALEGAEWPLADFLEQLGITPADLRRVLETIGR